MSILFTGNGLPYARCDLHKIFAHNPCFNWLKGTSAVLEDRGQQKTNRGLIEITEGLIGD